MGGGYRIGACLGFLANAENHQFIILGIQAKDRQSSPFWVIKLAPEHFTHWTRKSSCRSCRSYNFNWFMMNNHHWQPCKVFNTAYFGYTFPFPLLCFQDTLTKDICAIFKRFDQSFSAQQQNSNDDVSMGFCLVLYLFLITGWNFHCHIQANVCKRRKKTITPQVNALFW